MADDHAGSGPPVRLETPVQQVEWRLIRLPLPHPILLGEVRITQREYLWVSVQDARGIRGHAYALTRGLPLDAIMEPVARLVLGVERLEPQAFVRSVQEALRFAGPNGLVSRAISAVELALWDLYACSRGAPLWNVLGASTGVVPLVVVAGYRREGEPADAVRRQIEEAAARGCHALKLMTGHPSAEEDVAYVRAVMSGYRGSTPVWLDVNGAWSPGARAHQAVIELRNEGISLIEEPYPQSFPVDRLSALQVEGGVPLAVGEFDHDLRIQRMYADAGIDILRPDATIIGGASSWLAIASELGQEGKTVFPHYFAEMHAHLVAATPNALAAEIVPDWTTGFDLVAAWPASIEAQMLRIPDTPGFGMTWDFDAIDKYSVRGRSIVEGA